MNNETNSKLDCHLDDKDNKDDIFLPLQPTLIEAQQIQRAILAQQMVDKAEKLEHKK